MFKASGIKWACFTTMCLASLACKAGGDSRSYSYGKDMTPGGTITAGAQSNADALPTTIPAGTTTTTPSTTTTTTTTTTPATSDATTPPATDSNTTAKEKLLEHFVGSSYRPFDIIITWDDSGSMDDKIAKLEKNVRDFVTELNDKKADFKVTMMGVGFAFPTDLDNFRVIEKPIGSHNSLTYLNDFIKSAGAVRDGAALDVVMITDDNAAAPETVAAQMATSIKGVKIRYNSIIGLKAGVNTQNCSAKSIGAEYKTLSDQSSGMVLDICALDFDPLLQKFFASLTLVNQVYQLKAKVDTTAPIIVTVDGKTLEAKDFTVDAAAATLKVADAALTHEKADVAVEYTKAP